MTLLFVRLSFATALFFCANGQLSTNFYAATCPNLEAIVRIAMRQAIRMDQGIAAAILRMYFHDCFVQGCDASILLDDTTSFTGEKNAAPNANSVRGYEVIDVIKLVLEAACTNTVSCADIITLAARDAVALMGGPSWSVQLGRRDTSTASLATANTDLPGPNADLDTLKSMFLAKGLNDQDLTVLSAAHTIGTTLCSLASSHLSDADVNSTFAARQQARCRSGNGRRLPIDAQTPTQFDNQYFKNLIARNSVLHSDQALLSGGSTDSLVMTYSDDQNAFFADFVTAMIKMGSIGVLTGTAGEIRRNCRLVNN